jgi:hypothetical protein
MKTKRYVPLLLLVSLALPFAATARTAQVESRWQTSPLKIDGDIGDWLSPAFQVEKGVQVHYAFCNDADNLYLIFIFKDPKYLSSLNRTGLTVWFNEAGRKKKQQGLRFEKMTLSTAALIAVMEKKSGPLSEEKKKEMLSKPAYVVNQFTAVDGDGQDQTERVFPAPPLPEFASAAMSGALAFEVRIPIGAGSGLNLSPGKSVSVGFDWGGLTKEMRRGMMRRGGYEGGNEPDMIETPDFDADSTADPGSAGLPSMRGPKHYLFWCELAIAAGPK